MVILTKILFAGLAVGCIYALVALGFVLIWKSTEVVNFAHGELLMIGAFVMYSMLTYFELNFWLAFALTLSIMAFLGIFLERLLVRPLLGQPLFAIVMMTFGLSIVLRGSSGLLWTFETIEFPSYYPSAVIMLGKISVPTAYVTIILTSTFLVLTLFFFFKFTRLGTAMRACGQNQLAAYGMGINVKHFFSLCWAIGSILATIGGVLLAPIFFLDVNLGHIGMKAIPAAILGGFESIPGAIVGGLILGLAESLAGMYLPPGYRDVIAYIILIVILVIRPTGLFGAPERTRV